jgi:MFS family permease
MNPEEKSTSTSSSRSVLLWLVAIGFFMQTLDGTIVNTALPTMAEALGESPLRMQSVIVAYSLTMAMLIPASGWMPTASARGASTCGRLRCSCWARCCVQSRPTCS